MGLIHLGNGRAAYTASIPRYAHDSDSSTSPPPPQQARGVGWRDRWPLLPVGEAARRDPRVPDPVPNSGPAHDQRDASPRVQRVGPLNAGGGIDANGMFAALTYVKQIGRMVTRSTSREILMGVVDAQWRVGGVGYPVESSMGPGSTVGAPGYHGDSTTVDPENKFNPQVTMRNPGIRPITGVPASYRYAPMHNTLLYGQYQGRIAGGRPSTVPQ